MSTLRTIGIVLPLLLGGCFVNSIEYSPFGPERGSAVLRWTIDGRANDTSCEAAGATKASVAIADAGGDVVKRGEPSCDDFTSRYELEGGTYTVTMALIDDEHRIVVPARSVRITIDGDDPVYVDIAFATEGPT